MVLTIWIIFVIYFLKIATLRSSFKNSCVSYRRCCRSWHCTLCLLWHCRHPMFAVMKHTTTPFQGRVLLKLNCYSFSHAVNCRRFCFWRRQSVVFCVWNISGTIERICTKFTQKICLIPCSDEFEGQMSRSPGTKTAVFGGLCVACVWWNIFSL